MSDRFCEKCGGKSSPYMPRTRVGDEMWCSMCAMNHGRRTAANEIHPDNLWQRAAFGAHHTTGGRALLSPRTAATHDEQEARMSDQSGWLHHSSFQPVRFAIEGARAYAAKQGLGDPHEHGFEHVRQDPHTVRSVGRLYDALPHHDPSATSHFDKMGEEVDHQFHHLTHTMGVNVQSVDHDPYRNVHEMVQDVNLHKRLKVMGTHVTGGHPYFSDQANDKFRAVHDFFGHAATGRDFDRHGEQAAYLAHSKMFSAHARPALTSETKGQNASLILNGHFGPQKIAVLPRHHWDDSSLRGADPRHAVLLGIGPVRPPDRFAIPFERRRQAGLLRHLRDMPPIRLLAHDSGDGETIFHCPFCGSGQVLARSDGAVDCEFCQTAFTVQVQPQMPSFPQTIDGMPVQVPGMPAGGQNANVPPGGDPMVPGAPGEDPMAAEGDPAAEEEPEEADDDKPAFLKGSALDERAYMQHLALRFLPDRERVLARVRHENGAR